jgi:hypothetical protein
MDDIPAILGSFWRLTTAGLFGRAFLPYQLVVDCGSKLEPGETQVSPHERQQSNE